MSEVVNTILVDENDDFLDALAGWLEQEVPGLRVVARAHSAFEALDLAALHPPDLVISDAFPPGASGFQIARKLQTIAPGAAVVLLTGHDLPEVEADRRAFGLVACISKSAVMRRLVPAVQRLLAARTPTTRFDP